jgi:hypothetical protein
LGLYIQPTEEDIEELQAVAGDEAADTLETRDAKIDGNFAAKPMTLDRDGGFIYVYYYPDELFNYNLIKEKAPQVHSEAKPPRYKGCRSSISGKGADRN